MSDADDYIYDFKKKFAVILSLFTLIFWIVFSFFQLRLSNGILTFLSIALIYAILFIYFVFIFKLPSTDNTDPEKSMQREPLLHVKDCGRGIPVKGIFFLVLMFTFGGLVIWFEIPQWIGTSIKDYLPTNLNIIVFYFLMGIAVIFLTELFSNTTTAITFFPIAYGLSLSYQVNAMPGIAIVALTSMCAFMSPIATPANALAFGSLDKFYHRKLMITGFFVNIFGAAWLSWAVPYFFNFK
jgi:sodium-dependent dicarboxylate transporter 2/3/5